MGDVISLVAEEDAPEPKRKKLTKSVVDRLVFDADGTTNQVWWDTETTGFGVRLNPGGSKTFVLQYRNAAGKLKRISLGKYGGQMTVAQGRQLAKETIATVVQGGDPLADRQAARSAPDGLTFGELARWYIEDYAKQRRKSWETDEKRLFPTDLTAPMYTFHKLRPGEHTREEVEDALDALHVRLADHPTSANRVAQLVNAVLNHAVKKRKVRGEFKNIIDRIDLNEENSRDDWIRPAELGGLVGGTMALAPEGVRGTSPVAEVREVTRVEPAIWHHDAQRASNSSRV